MILKRMPRLDGVPQKNDWGTKVRTARMECGLSQIELALQVGLKSATGISLIESNRRGLDIRMMELIAYTCNKPFVEFLSDNTPKQ